MTDIRFKTGFRSADTDDPGLVMEDDGTVWLINPDGSRTQITGGGGGVGPQGPQGDPGEQGEQGEPGDQGIPGTSNLELYVGDFGAVGDGVTDDTAAIQATLDAADALSVSSSEVPNVVLGPHIYSVTDELGVDRSTFRGQHPNSSTRLVWNGSAGGRMVVKLAGYQTSFGMIQDINFRGGSALPATFIDFTEATNALDKFLILSRLNFTNCSGDAIKVGAWVNQHWNHMRWDGIGGYAMRFTTAGGMSGDSFVLENFTYDHSLVSGQGEGFCYIDNQAGGGSLFTIRGGRIEVNNAWNAPQAMLHIRAADVTPAARLMAICLEDIAFAGSAGGAEVFFYRETAATTGSESLILKNVSMSSTATMFGGTWPSTMYLPPVSNYGLLVLNTNGSSSLAPYDITTSRIGILANSTEPALVMRRAADTGDRYRMSGFGAHEWADAAGGAMDTNLYRSAANVLKTDDKMVAVLGLGAGNSLAATTLGTVVRKMEIFSGTGASLGFIAIYDAIA